MITILVLVMGSAMCTDACPIPECRSLEDTLKGCEFILEKYTNHVIDLSYGIELEKVLSDDLLYEYSRLLTKYNSMRYTAFSRLWPLFLILAFVVGTGIGASIGRRVL